MEKSTAHEGGIIIKTFVVEEDVAGRDPLRQREKEHMAEPPVRQIAARDALAAHVARRTARTDRQTEHSSTTTTDVSTGTRSSASSSPQAELATPRPATSSQLELYGPRTTILDLLTDSATPSALPQTLGFHISRKARQIAIYNSTHIHLVDTEALPRAFVRTLEVKRRPVALDMLDDGSMLLLLDTPTVLNVYKLNGGDGDAVERKCSIDLQHESKTIAVSADGLVAAVGNQFGVELIALDTTAKRQVSVDRMDSISFSDDGRTLLATSRAKGQGASTTISVAGPYDGPLSLDGIPAPLEVDRAWTSQILFPEKAKTCKHAVLLPDVPFGQSTALFAYNTVEHTWGIYNLEACTFIFSNEFLPDVARWMRQQFIEDALPAVSPSANHVAIAITQHGRPEIWVYRLPRNVEDMQSLDDSDDSEGKNAVLRPCMRIPLPKEEISSSQDLAAMQWLTVPQDSSIERLVVVGSTHAAQAAEDPMSDLPAGATSSGVIIVMDFDLQEQPGQRRLPPQKIVFDLDMLLPGEKLPEDEVVFEREVELLRRRTVAQRDAANRAARRSIAREPTSPVPRVPPMPPRPVSRYDMAGEPLSPIVADADEETLNADEAAVAFEEPYTHAQPRSQASLHRAATVAAASSAARRHLRALPDRPLEYRRADGLREIPHESDADNWVPPPPPYSPNPGPSDAGTVARSPAQGATPQAPAIARRPAPTLPRILVPGAAPAPASIPLSAPGVQAPTVPPQVQAVPQVRAMPQPQAMPARAQAPSPIPPAAPAQVVTPAPLRSRTNGRRNSRASRSITSLVSALGSSPSPPAEQIQPSLAPSPTPMAANQVPILSSPSPSTLQPRRTFPRQGGDPNPAANLVPNPDGSGLRRSSNTFPTPAELRNSRPLPPTPTPLQPRHMDIFEYQGPWSRAGAGGQEASAYNEAVTARASTLLDRAHSPYTPKQEKKSARCVIM